MAIRSIRPADVQRFQKSADLAEQAKARNLQKTSTTSATSATSTDVPVETKAKKPALSDEFSTEKSKASVQTATTIATKAENAQLALATKVGAEPGVELGSQAAMSALVQPHVAVAETGPIPSANHLQKQIAEHLGPAAAHLSAVEIAAVLGKPEWAPGIAKLPASKVKQGQGQEPNWLVAAQLTRWMRGIDAPGITLADVAKSFKAANAMAQTAVPHLDGAFVAALQKAYPFMPQWSVAPVRTTVDDDWTAMPSMDDVWTQKFDAALQSISEVPLTLPLSNSVGVRLAEGRPFAKHNVVMVQHMLGQAVPLCQELARGGMDMSKAEYVGVPYQKNPAVKLSLERSMGLKVTVPERGDIDGMWDHVCAAVDRAFERHLENGEPILVLDDGGYASKYIAHNYADHAEAFCVVEQTTRGLTEISQIDPKPTFPIANVAGSYGKRFESAQVGDAVVQCVRRVLDEVATTPTRKEVLVVGGGKVGLGVADSFKGDGARVTFFDPYVTPSRKKELEALGYTVITDKAEALNKKFLVVGCSGHRSIDMEDFVKMSSPVFLASASSKRVEIDTLGLADLTKGDDGVMRRILAAKVNEQETWHYWTQDGRIITAVADGLPANFQDVNSIAPELIDHTMALMLLGAEKAALSRGKAAGLVELDAGQQFELQAQMEGLTQQATSPSDIGLQVGELTFHGSKAVWTEIAKSAATPPAVTEALIEKFLEKDPMNSVLLEALHQPKEISDAALDRVLSLGVLPHISRLMKNEGLRGDQEDKLIAWCTDAYSATTGQSRHTNVTSVYGVDKAADGRWRFSECMRPSRPEARAQGILTEPAGTIIERDLVVRQLGEILFAHPRCPDGFKRHMLDDQSGSKLRFFHQANVHSINNPSWTTAELHALLKPGLSFLYSLGREKQPRSSYAYDVLDAFRNHPSADEGIIAEAERVMGFIREAQAEQRRDPPRGKADWIESPLGGTAPAYE